MRARLLLLGVLGFAAGCRPQGLSASSASFTVSPTTLALPSGYAGSTVTSAVELTNTSLTAVELTFATEPPFSSEAAVTLPAGATRSLEVHFRSASSGHFDGVLRVDGPGGPVEVALSAVALERPECTASSDCTVARFDDATGKCVEDPAPEGQACGAADQCLRGGTCQAGVCRGTARDCDDGNQCTLDSCSPQLGCRHEDLTDACPGDGNPCHTPTCSPQTGCGVATVADGTSCGGNDCVTAHVCLAGSCEAKAAPEGSQCRAATACEAPATCHQGSCDQPVPGPPKLRWRHLPLHPAPDGFGDLFFQGQLDAAGNAYLFEFGATKDRHAPVSPRIDPPAGTSCEETGDCIERQLVSLSPDGVERYRVPVRPGCLRCLAGYAVDEAGVVFISGTDFLQARSAGTGALLWEVPTVTGLPVLHGMPDGGGSFYSEAPILLGGGQVAVPVTEGWELHDAYVRVFSRATGARTFDYHRGGHLYGTGASGNGSLWSSSAGCWAPMGQLEQVASDGGVHTSRFLHTRMLAFGDEEAIGMGNDDGLLRIVDRSAVEHVVDAGLPYTSPLVLRTPGRLLVYSPPGFNTAFGALHDVDPAGRSVRWAQSFPGPSTVTSLAALESGGVLLLDSGGKRLWGVEADGGVGLRCTMPAEVASPLSLVRDQLVLEENVSIAAYALPGMKLAPKGWVLERGGPGHGGAPR
ncbi:MAG: hypothetical protein K1X89_29270 [Myxococcaceae bacterium]|nr:hypothetical protein [Myxococcaceae bacterium]